MAGAWLWPLLQLATVMNSVPAVWTRRAASRAGVGSDVGLQPSLAPPELLLLSSPSERKVSYLQLADLHALRGAVRPLVDWGLGGPRGIAYDASSGKLYIADPPKRRVVCYPLKVRRCSGDGCQLDYELSVAGTQVVVVQDVLTSWVTVDHSGSLYYTDQEAMSVNKIDSLALERIFSMTLNAADLRLVTRDALSALAAQPADRKRGSGEAAVEAELQRSIQVLHEADSSSHLTMPSGLLSDGVAVYWANLAQGRSRGSVAVGAANLQMPGGGAEGNETVTLSNTTDIAYGVARTFDKILFTGAEHGLFTASRAGNASSMLSDSFGAARGLVWDGDCTMYVADMGSNAIYSLPSDSSGEAFQSLQTVVQVHGPFGLALIGAPELAALDAGHSQNAGSRNAGLASEGGAATLAACSGLVLLAGVHSRWA